MFLQKNINMLKKKDFKKASILEKIEALSHNFNFFYSKSEKLTVEYISEKGNVLLHSKYDPVKEAKVFAKKYIDHTKKNYILYGFAMGYHIKEMINLINEDENLIIVESNLELLKNVFEKIDLEFILNNKNVNLIFETTESKLANELKKYLNKESKFIIHYPSIKIIPQEYEYFKFIIEDWNIKNSVDEDWFKQLSNNKKLNLELKDNDIFNNFLNLKDKHCIIVSAGPSLDKNIKDLKNIDEKFFILSVGTALKPLLKFGIKPDVFLIIDPFEETYNQISGIENISIPLIYLETASNFTVSKYKGPRYIVFEESEELKEGVKVGGSVSTAALDLAIKLGSKNIIFVGQDLAFSSEKTHVKGSMYDDEKIEKYKTGRKVEGQNGEMLDTTLGFLSFKYFIENRIKEEPQLKFFNATQGGAKINGCIHKNLIEVLKILG